MYLKHLIAVSAAAVVAATGGIAYAAASSTPDITTAQTVQLVAHQTSFSFVPVPRQTSNRPVPGDQIVFTERLSRGGTTAGTDQINCTVVGRALICDVVFAIRGGTISVNGKVPLNGPGRGGASLAVTGGTGRYQNARGQVDVRRIDRNTEAEILHLIP